MNEKTPTPAVGQVWADNDPRSASRRVQIVEIDSTHAVVELYAPRQHEREAGRRTRIRLDRFRPTSTGYRYVGTAGGAR